MNMPASWRYLKLDLFDNATNEQMMLNKQVLKLTINFQKEGESDWNYLRAKLNSPLRHMRRGVGDEHDLAHYKLVEDLYHGIKSELGKDLVRINASKVYRKGYADTKKSVNGISAVIWRDTERWNTALVIKQEIYQFSMNGANLSQKQRKTGVIASVKCSSAPTVYKMYNADDFL